MSPLQSFCTMLTSPIFQEMSGFFFPGCFLGSDWLLLRYGAEWRHGLLIGWCMESHLFHAGSPNPLISHTVWEEYGKNMAQRKKENRPVGSWEARCSSNRKKQKGVISEEYRRRDKPKRQFGRRTAIFLFQFFQPLPPHPFCTLQAYCESKLICTDRDRADVVGLIDPGGNLQHTWIGYFTFHLPLDMVSFYDLFHYLSVMCQCLSLHKHIHSTQMKRASLDGKPPVPQTAQG